MKFAAALDFWKDVNGAIPPGKLDEAKTCAVNNVVLHATQIFEWSKIDAELVELVDDAKLNGVRFSEVCGDAVLPKESEKKPCYICRGMAAARGEMP